VAAIENIEARRNLVETPMDAFHDFAYHLGREVESRGLAEEEFLADLERTKREVFTEQYGHPA